MILPFLSSKKLKANNTHVTKVITRTFIHYFLLKNRSLLNSGDKLRERKGVIQNKVGMVRKIQIIANKVNVTHYSPSFKAIIPQAAQS